MTIPVVRDRQPFRNQGQGTPGWKTPPLPPPKPANKPPNKPHKPVGLSPQAWAQKQAEMLISAQIKAINDQKTAYLLQQSQLQNQGMQRAAAMYAAMMGQDYGGKVGSAYGGAADTIRGEAAGLGGVMQHEAEGSAAIDNRILSGTGQEARDEGAGMNDVFSHAYGIIPGSALDQIGKAYAGDAAAQPRFDMQEALLNAVRDNQPDTSDFFKQISELQASRPELVMKLMSQRQGLAMDRLKQKWAMQDRRLKMQDAAYKRKIDAQDRARDWYLDQAKLAMSEGNYERAQAYYNLAVQREDRMGQKQQFDQQYKLSHPSGSTTSGAKAWGDVQEDISNDISDLTIEIPDPADKYSPNPRKIEVPMGYSKAFNILFARYSGRVKDKARLRRMITKILASAGIHKKKGELYGAKTGDHSYDVPVGG